MIGGGTLRSKVLGSIPVTCTALELHFNDVLTLDELFHIRATCHRIYAVPAERVIPNSYQERKDKVLF